MRIALLEDDKSQAELLRSWFRDAGHECLHFETGAGFLQAVGRESFDLAVLDWGLPDITGDEVLARLRQRVDWPMPVLFVTSRDQEEDVVRALELGADDYMSKPVRRGETLARVAALQRRAFPVRGDAPPRSFPPYDFDAEARRVRFEGEEVSLTQKEFELALFLFRNQGRLLSRGHILEAVWNTAADLNTRTVDTHVSRIRTKLKLAPRSGWKLSSVYQHGYRLEHLGEVDTAQL